MNDTPTKGEYLARILRAPQTVFTVKDVALLWKTEIKNREQVRLSEYVKNKKLIRIHRGIYAKDENYNRLELATRIYTPSYISFETVLTQEGINFQFYNNMFVASYVTRNIEVKGQKISFLRMKDYVLSDITGIENSTGVATATKERAFLDRIYISKEYHFDNLNSLDWGKVFEILPIYHNKRMEKKVKEYFEYHKHNQ